MTCSGMLRFSQSLSLLVFLLAVGCASGPPSPGAAMSSQSGSLVQDDPSSGQEVPPGAQSQTQEQDTRPGVGVWPFSNGGSFGSDPWDYESLGIGLQQMLITELSLNSGLRLVERSRLREIIEELELGQGGYIDPSTTASVGRLVQARYMIVGSFVDANGTMRFDARIDDVETGEVLTETAAKVQADRDDVLDMVIDLGIKLVEAANLPTLPEEIVEERKELNYPPEAVQLYSRALRREERGDLPGMTDLLRQLATDFPQHIEGRQMLEQYGVGDPLQVDLSSRRSK